MFDDLDRAVDAVARNRDQWIRVPVAERIALARRCIVGCVDTAAAVVSASCRAKGLDPHSHVAAEEWLSGPVPVIRNLRLLIETLSEIDRSGMPRVQILPPESDECSSPSPCGVAVEVFPNDTFDRLLYPDVRINVRMQPDVTAENLAENVAAAYNGASHAVPGVVLVLGAGNVSSIGPMDVLYKLFVENHVVILKMHPLNAYLGPLIERAFEPLVERGYLRVVYGDAREGEHLVQHPLVDEVHITGSSTVHDIIVWGDTAQEQPERRTSGRAKLTKRITSELGCVTPVIVVPGDWSTAEIDYQAENVATMVAHNASCNCNAAKLLVTSARWPARRAFLNRIEAILATLPPRSAYYPGSAKKYSAFVAGRSICHRLGGDIADALPFTTILDLDPGSDDLAFREEAWSPILAETALTADAEETFVDDAVRFCNDRVAGTLSAVVIVDPRTQARLGARLTRAIRSLRYGTVAVNHWSAMSYALAVAPWGAYPGHTLAQVGSGIGFVHNTKMLDRPLKTELWGPFTTSPKPVWFCTHRRAHVAARQMVAFEASPSAWRLPSIALAAYRS
jgi:acyl-CoA reductase-like NAD-dependent aldehyde dehydrogenase